MIVVQEDTSTTPLCPHCESPLTTVNGTVLNSRGAAAFSFGKRYLYSCPTCHKSLGVSHRKGFWMG